MCVLVIISLPLHAVLTTDFQVSSYYSVEVVAVVFVYSVYVYVAHYRMYVYKYSFDNMHSMPVQSDELQIVQKMYFLTHLNTPGKQFFRTTCVNLVERILRFNNVLAVWCLGLIVNVLY